MEFDKDKAVQWIKEHTNEDGVDCPICRQNDWLLLDRIWRLGEFTDVIKFGSSVPNFMPMVALMCDNCGYTIFFNAFTIGVLSRK